MKTLNILTAIVLVVLITFALALATAAASDKPDVVKDLKIPGALVKGIEFNSALDLYEVAVADGQLFYLTKDRKHVIFGNIFETISMRNITEERKSVLFKVDFSKLPLDKAIKISEGDKKIAVFTSPDCPWCRKLHQEIKKLEGVSAYAFLVPYGSQDKIKSIVCASNKQGSLEKAYFGEALPPISNCSYQPVIETGSLAKSVYINAYPTIITDDGRRISGYLPFDKLKDVIFNKATQKTALRGK